MRLPTGLRARCRLALLRPADWPFSFKMGFLPGIGVMALIGIVGSASLALNQQTGLIRVVIRQDMDIATRLAGCATRLQRVDAGLYRILALQAAKSSPRPVSDDIADLLASLDGVLADLAAYRLQLPDGEKRRRVDALLGDLATYRGAIEVVGSMLELDFASAVAFVRPFDGNTRSTLAALSGLVDNAVREAAARATQATSAASRAQAVFAATAALVALLVATLALVITRATVRSVGAIAEATVQVARGDPSVDIDRLARRDELGAIVESLQAFKDNVARVAFLAHHDALTGLPNRTLFNDRLNGALAGLGRGHAFAVLCLDLDRFKVVNDTLGHPVGDLLLRQVAERVSNCVRKGDTVSRLGGDEFAVIALDMASSEAAASLAQRIVAALNETFDLDGHHASIGCSIGIALAPGDGGAAERLLKNADTALYRAKTEGRNTYRFFEAAMDAKLQWRNELQIEIRSAIAAHEFQLHYQPVIEVATMQVCGFEALLRWPHPERGMIPPIEFIPVAEESGQIIPLGEWALQQACQDAQRWPDSVRVAVNLSPVQFRDAHLLRMVLAALETSGLRADRLEVEITESVLLRSSEANLDVLNRLRAYGVRIALDDFGTGYSSLSYLRIFPFDKIKIDQSFVRDLTENEGSMAIVRALVGLSGSLGVTTTAEGVETEEQFERLVAEGCTQVQGYLFGRPAPASEVVRTIARFAARQSA